MQKHIGMAEQLLQGSDVFEITDHTTASDWERFTANIEEVLADWKLHKQSEKSQVYQELPIGYISAGIWRERHDVLRLGNVSFDIKFQYLDNIDSKLTLYKDELDQASDSTHLDTDSQSKFKLRRSSRTTIEDSGSSDGSGDEGLSKEKDEEHEEYNLPENTPECLRDLVATNNDFASKAHCLVRWYNLRKFIILSPRGDTIVSEDRVKLILSSASIALANIDCHVPIFVQIHNPKNNFYQGISEHLNYRTMYEMIFYKRNIKQHEYLSELIVMFREKIGCNLNDPISVTIRLNYCLDNLELFTNPVDEFDGTEYIDHDDLASEASSKRVTKLISVVNQDMRTSATFEQVTEALKDTMPHPYRILKFLHIAALWPPVSDKVITDSQVHSDLDPAEAPIWKIRCVTSDNCNMKIVHQTQALYDVLAAAVDYAYDKMSAEEFFDDCDRKALKARCLRLCYELSIEPEVILSEKPTDSIRKVIALLFHRANELRADSDALDQIAEQLKKQPSLDGIYRNFSRRNRPSVKEFIIKTQISRPFNPISHPALPQRLFCTVCDEEYRLCGAFTELCN